MRPYLLKLASKWKQFMAALNENNGNSHSTTQTGPTPCHCLRTKNPVPFFHPLQIWIFLTAVNAKASTRQTWHIGHMASDLCTLLVQTIGQISVHLLFGPVSHVPHSFPRNTQAWQAPVRPKESLVRRRPRTYTPTCTRLWEMSMGPTIHHRPSSSGPRPPEGTRRLSPKRPKPTPAGPEKNPMGPPNPTPPAGAEVAASPNLTPPGPKITPVRLPGACWRRSSWPTSKRR
jgi:hypothetical protein